MDNEQKTPKIIELVVKYSGGLIRDEKQASYLLLGLTIAAILISLVFIIMQFNNSKVADTSKSVQEKFKDQQQQFLPQ